MQTIAFGLGGEAGARLATQLQMLVSADTLLRLIRNRSPPKLPTPKQVGVDDWALRKRVTYGTIVVDSTSGPLATGSQATVGPAPDYDVPADVPANPGTAHCRRKQ